MKNMDFTPDSVERPAAVAGTTGTCLGPVYPHLVRPVAARCHPAKRTGIPCRRAALSAAGDGRRQPPPDLALLAGWLKPRRSAPATTGTSSSACCAAQSRSSRRLRSAFASHLLVDVIAHHHFVPEHEHRWFDWPGGHPRPVRMGNGPPPGTATAGPPRRTVAYEAAATGAVRRRTLRLPATTGRPCAAPARQRRPGLRQGKLARHHLPLLQAPRPHADPCASTNT